MGRLLSLIDQLMIKIQYIFLKKYYKKSNYKKIINLRYKVLLYALKKDINMFKDIKKNIESINLNNYKSKEKIKVGFVLNTASMWSCEELYNMMKNSQKYDPYIIVCQICDGNRESRKKMYDSTYDYFCKKNYKVLRINKSTSRDIDLFIYLTPFKIIQNSINIESLRMDKLTSYITYSFMIADRDWKFDLPTYLLTWKFFADSKIYKDLIGQKSLAGNDNVIFCGFTRMDEFLKEFRGNVNDIWKGNAELKTKIIYAPHHSVFDPIGGFSTFDLNYEFIFELAKKYQNETSWIIKPHPALAARIISNGFFKSNEEYDSYLRKWNELSNAKVVTDGTYFDIFKTSDLMITDSVSFLAEYQYVHKPLIFLTRDTQKFNEFGNKLKGILYNIDGSDYAAIEEKIVQLIDGKDDMKEIRDNFFDEYLNYVKINKGYNATEYIYNFYNQSFNIEEDAK